MSRLARFAEISHEQLDPAGPTPARCFDLGRAVIRAYETTDKRVALVASSSWSHAFLCDKLWHLRPDTDADQRLYEALQKSDYDTWRQVTGRQVVEAGQHEMLNWFCLLGAMSPENMRALLTDFFAVDKSIITEDQVRAVTVPTLLVHGREDKVVPPQVSWTMVNLLPDADLHVFARCGHWTQIERAAEFNALVADFLTGSAR
jgi:pimeloyl-ACP methyl ester carboxylesterase